MKNKIKWHKKTCRNLRWVLQFSISIHNGGVRWEKMTHTQSGWMTSSCARSVPNQWVNTTAPTSRRLSGPFWVPLYNRNVFRPCKGSWKPFSGTFQVMETCEQSGPGKLPWNPRRWKRIYRLCLYFHTYNNGKSHCMRLDHLKLFY